VSKAPASKAVPKDYDDDREEGSWKVA
jgi:hypothetical protein